MAKNKNKSKVYQANTILKQRIGSGPMNPEIVKRAQQVLDENKIDFSPLGFEFLEKLDTILKGIESKENDASLDEQKQELTRPVMELKANAAFFNYPLIGNLANIMLGFLETIDELDTDAISIVRAHHGTLNQIIQRKMVGDGGEHGKVFMEELQNACNRYYNKRKK